MEDLVFKSDSIYELCSVGVDRQMLFWDVRSNKNPTMGIQNLHTDDINSVDWSKLDHNYVISGSSDRTAAIVDIRKLASG